jgi:hypothetical protein
MPYKIYISFARKDIDLARDLAKRVGMADVTVLMSEESTNAGENFAGKVNSELRKADEAVFILTNNSVRSQWLLFEMGVATSLDTPVTPIIQGIEPKQLPPVIRQMKYIKYSDVDRYIIRLQQRAKQMSESAK